MYITGDGIKFQGSECLVSNPDESEWFTDRAVMLERVNDCIALNVSGVFQVRLISELWDPDIQ